MNSGEQSTAADVTIKMSTVCQRDCKEVFQASRALLSNFLHVIQANVSASTPLPPATKACKREVSGW